VLALPLNELLKIGYSNGEKLLHGRRIRICFIEFDYSVESSADEGLSG